MDAVGSDRANFKVNPLIVFRPVVLLASLVGIVALPAMSEGHAFPVRSEPRVGWTVANSPPKVTIWFDGELEPAFSTITVYNSVKQQVDKGNSRVTGQTGPSLKSIYRFWPLAVTEFFGKPCRKTPTSPKGTSHLQSPADLVKSDLYRRVLRTSLRRYQ